MCLAEDVFWRLTLRQLDALIKRHVAAQERNDWRTGLICSVLANINRDTQKRKEPYSPEEFMPTKRKVKRKQSPEEMLMALRLWNAAIGGKEV